MVKQDSATVADWEQVLADLLVAQVVEHLPTEPDGASGFEECSSTAPGFPCKDSAVGPDGTPALDTGKVDALRGS